MGAHKDAFWEGLVTAVQHMGSGEPDEIDMAVLAPMTTDLALPWVRDLVKAPAETWPRLLERIGGMMPDGPRADLEAMPLHIVHRAAQALLERFVQDRQQRILRDLQQIDEAEGALASAESVPAGSSWAGSDPDRLERDILRQSDTCRIADQASRSASDRHRKALERMTGTSERRLAILMAETHRPVPE